VAPRQRASRRNRFHRRAGRLLLRRLSAFGRDGGAIADAGLALSAVGPTTVYLTRAEEALRGKTPSEELFAEAAQMASEDCAPIADGRGPVDYKRHLAGALTKRALRRATARALHQEV
jgi:carbon-monoxide dehydrogenase medium subunit